MLNLGAAGAALTLDGGTLLTTAAITSARPVTLAAGGGTIDNGGFADLFSGPLTGPGALTVTGAGTVTLAADNELCRRHHDRRGTLRIGNGGTTGSITGDVANNGTLLFDRSDTLAFGGMISGSGSLVQAGPGTTVLTGANSYTGGTTIAAGTLRLGDGGTSGSIVGDVANDGTLVFDRSNALVFDGVISGTWRGGPAGHRHDHADRGEQLYRRDQRHRRPAAGRRLDRRRRQRGERRAPRRHRHDRRDGDHRRRRAPRARAKRRHADRRLAGAERRLAARLRVLAARHRRRRDQRPDRRQRRADARRHAQPRRCRRPQPRRLPAHQLRRRAHRQRPGAGEPADPVPHQRHADLDRHPGRGQPDRQPAAASVSSSGMAPTRSATAWSTAAARPGTPPRPTGPRSTAASTPPGKAVSRCSRAPPAR